MLCLALVAADVPCQMIENNGWNSVFCSNHDNPRAVSRYTDDSTPESAALGAKLLALMQTTLGGTP